MKKLLVIVYRKPVNINLAERKTIGIFLMSNEYAGI